MTVSERIPFSGLLLPLQEGYTYSCDRRTTDGMELLFIAYLEEPYVPHEIVGAIDKNPAQGVILLDEKK